MTQKTDNTTGVDSQRRILTQAICQTVWVAPVVTAVTLPVHAQTSNPLAAEASACTAVGTWDAKGVANDNINETANFSFVLHADGTATADNTSLPPINWSESGGTVALVMHDPDPSNTDFVTLSGAISPDCNFIAGGTLTTSVKGDVQEIGTWTAARRS